MDESDQGPGAANGSVTPGPPGDAVDAVVDKVRQQLAARRASGVLPHMPAGELDRQFSAVIEAVDAGLVEEPPQDTGPLAGLAVLETWRPGGGGRRARVARPLAHLWSRLVGAVVRRQVGGFSRKVTDLMVQLVHRQNRMQAFLARTYLDRLRGLEYRVAELEREVSMLRAEPTAEQRGTGRAPADDAR